MEDEKLLQDEELIEEVTAENGKELQALDHVLPSHLSILSLVQRPIFPGITIPNSR